MPQLVRALLIEADAKLRATITRLLAQAAIEVTPAESLSTTILRCDVDRFDCVVASSSLPEGSGPALVQRIRRVIPPVPLVVVGDSDDPSIELLALGAGADEYVVRTDLLRRGCLARAVRRAIARDGADERRRQDHHAERIAALVQVASAVAHQVNNPVAFIASNTAVLRGYLDDLSEAIEVLGQSGADPSWLAAWRTRFDLDRVLSDARQICVDNTVGLSRVGSIVADLGTFVRPPHETRRYLDMNAVVEHAYWAVEPALRERARVEWRLQPVPEILGEERHLEEVISHLLRNAMQALEPADVHDHRVTIQTRVDDGQVVVSVSDTGCGMSRGARARAFEPFFTTRAAGDGAGLGLAVCDQVVFRHGGRIEIRDNHQRGTCCEVRLPAPSDRPQATRRESASLRHTGWPTRAPGLTTAGTPPKTSPTSPVRPRRDSVGGSRY